MIRTYLLLCLVLFILAVPRESVGQGGVLAELNAIDIVVMDLTSFEKRLGLSKEAISNQVLVLLRSKVPRLIVTDTANSVVFIDVSVDAIRTTQDSNFGHYGYVVVSIGRQVTIMETGRFGGGFIWLQHAGFNGPQPNLHGNINMALDQLLTAFAAAWYRDNPTK